MIRLWVAIAVALLLRVLWIAIAALQRGTEAFLVPDSWAYIEFAIVFATRGEFANVPGTPQIFRTPGYPLLLAPGYLIGHPIPFAIALNLLLTAAILAAVYVIAGRLFESPRIAAVCAVIVGIEPTMLTWSLRVMPETLLALCLVLFALFALRALEVPRVHWIIGAAAALCAAAYVKPVIWPFVLVIGVAAVVAPLISRVRFGVRQGIAFLLACVTLLAPWHFRNYQRAGYAGFSTVMERAVYIAAAGPIKARREQRPYAEVQMELIQRAEKRPDHVGYLREGLSVVVSDPLGYATTHTKGMLRTLLEPGAMEYLRFLGVYSQGGRAVMKQEGVAGVARAYPLGFWLSIAVAVALLPLVVLPLVALVRLPRGARPAFAVLAMVAGYLILSGGGMAGTSRFRVPAVPFLVLMSAFVFRDSGGTGGNGNFHSGGTEKRRKPQNVIWR